jgi:hypothetical protein
MFCLVTALYFDTGIYFNFLGGDIIKNKYKMDNEEFGLYRRGIQQ